MKLDILVILDLTKYDAGYEVAEGGLIPGLSELAVANGNLQLCREIDPLAEERGLVQMLLQPVAQDRVKVL